MRYRANLHYLCIRVHRHFVTNGHFIGLVFGPDSRKAAVKAIPPTISHLEREYIALCNCSIYTTVSGAGK